MSTFIEQFPVVFNSLNIGFLQTLKLFAVTLLGALPLGLIIAFGSMSSFKPLSVLVRGFVWIIRGTPLMIQLMIIYYFPGIMFNNPIWNGMEDGRFVAASVAFIINYACYFSEIYRGGIESMSQGQYEAAEVLGYSRTQTFMRIILPQVVKRILPSITNEVITLVKDTSMAFTVGYQEMFTIGKTISNSESSFMPFLIAGVFYFLFNGIVDFVMTRLERKLNYYR